MSGKAFVYFVRAGDAGAVKIGFTRDVKKRMAELQTGCPDPLALLAAIETSTPRELEKHLHARLERHRIGKSEWFRQCAAIDLAIEDARRAPDRRFEAVTLTAVAPWHKPMCSHCGKPIENIADGLGGWYESDAGAAQRPFIVHNGTICDFYTTVEEVVDGWRLVDLPIEIYRRAPIAAIVPLLHRLVGDGDVDRAHRTTWIQWVNVVLGLPLSQWDHLTALKAFGEVAEVLLSKVSSLDDAGRSGGPW